MWGHHLPVGVMCVIVVTTFSAINIITINIYVTSVDTINININDTYIIIISIKFNTITTDICTSIRVTTINFTINSNNTTTNSISTTSRIITTSKPGPFGPVDLTLRSSVRATTA